MASSPSSAYIYVSPIGTATRWTVAMLKRRDLILGAAFGLLAALPWPAGSSRAAEVLPLEHTDAEWRRLLTTDQYAVLRESATEQPFTSSLLDEHRRGTFSCAGCRLDLFSSATKFESGTGWPSFWAPLDGAVGTENDTSFGMVRTAVSWGARPVLSPTGPSPSSSSILACTPMPSPSAEMEKRDEHIP